ncbi:TonB protein C-terminal [Algoriphagus halophilus]|uniref:TonB protein C-terminal n=1 Tax=Algoriphagus halophilus TaxID=226505 RepID=A0A1N6G4R0_9BACT|nr:TonB protein C-terminal [Algoriphagus halophilus]
MKFTYSKKNKNYTNILIIIGTLLLSLFVLPANAQVEGALTMEEMEHMQDQDMEFMKQLHKITKNYPAFSYEYTMNDGEISDVIVTGVDSDMDRKRLEVILFDLQSNRNMLKNKANRVGVFYSVDDPADFKGDLTRTVVNNLKYPEDAKDWGVEGTIFVKFVVDEDGEIPFATTSSNIETSVDIYLEDLQNQAVEAVEATSGEWEPATVEGVQVSSLEVLPITFDFQKNPTLPAVMK